MMIYLNRDMDGGPFLVYFLPILGGQKFAVQCQMYFKKIWER
jgi:hypothetical protein